jgi:hypothetical protein
MVSVMQPTLVDPGASRAETPSYLEPVSGIEPLTCRLQEVRHYARWALAAQMAQIIALTALTTLGLSGAPVHEPVHGRGAHFPLSRYCA